MTMRPGQCGGACGADRSAGTLLVTTWLEKIRADVLYVLLSQGSTVAEDQPASREGGRKILYLAQWRREVKKEHELVCCFLLHAQPQTLSWFKPRL